MVIQRDTVLSTEQIQLLLINFIGALRLIARLGHTVEFHCLAQAGEIERPIMGNQRASLNVTTYLRPDRIEEWRIPSIALRKAMHIGIPVAIGILRRLNQDTPLIDDQPVLHSNESDLANTGPRRLRRFKINRGKRRHTKYRLKNNMALRELHGKPAEVTRITGAYRSFPPAAH